MGSCSSNYISDAKLGQLLKLWAGEDKAQEESKVRRRLVLYMVMCRCTGTRGKARQVKQAIEQLRSALDLTSPSLKGLACCQGITITSLQMGPARCVGRWTLDASILLRITASSLLFITCRLSQMPSSCSLP